jgi:hypothetical protein
MATTLKYSRDRGLLFNRVGSANAQKQVHRKSNRAPVNRGIWAFPWPLNDYFFSIHQGKKFVKKGHETGGIPREIVKTHLKTKQIWWDRPFYSRLAPDAKMMTADWYLWDDFRAFIACAERSRFMWSPKYGRQKYSIDHLEVFLPETAQELPRIVIFPQLPETT